MFRARVTGVHERGYVFILRTVDVGRHITPLVFAVLFLPLLNVYKKGITDVNISLHGSIVHRSHSSIVFFGWVYFFFQQYLHDFVLLVYCCNVEYVLTEHVSGEEIHVCAVHHD